MWHRGLVNAVPSHPFVQPPHVVLTRITGEGRPEGHGGTHPVRSRPRKLPREETAKAPPDNQDWAAVPDLVEAFAQSVQRVGLGAPVQAQHAAPTARTP